MVPPNRRLPWAEKLNLYSRQSPVFCHIAYPDPTRNLPLGEPSVKKMKRLLYVAFLPFEKVMKIHTGKIEEG